VSLEPPQEGRGAAAALRESLLPERYRVIDRVAVGGMGSIWLAEDALLGRRVAVKILAEQFAAQPLFVERFEREARTAAALSGHPNVITIYDVGEHAGRPFIVMAYLSGGTLRDRIKAGRVDRAHAVQWLHQAASALDFAHSHGVVHRDVKPQNLLFDGEGRVVVADLGIARAAFEESLTASGELLGTASYISPEQAMGESATAASDRYSLAIVAYELLTGTKPFAAGGFAEQALKQVEAEPDPPSARTFGLNPEVDRILLRGLRKDPQQRWDSASGFASALADALARPRLPEQNVDHAATYTRRSRARIAAVGAALLGTVVLVGVVLISSGGDGGAGSGKSGDRAGRAPAKQQQTRNRQSKSTAPPAAPQRGAATPPPAPSTPSSPTTAGASPAVLNQQGFGLMNAGRYDQAIPVLQRAVAGFPDGSRDLTYAYALYNLGRSLRLAGRPGDAIPYLERRLGIANQREVVRRELAAARAAAG
jgi:eukaryotic-like serine/threonine-protein kinase